MYLASVVIYSGGFSARGYQPWDSEPDNGFAAMVVHGGQTDTYGGTVNFLELSQYYIDELLATDRFAIECNHEMGHLVGPQQNAVHQFLTDHPWGTRPYADGLPAEFPEYCSVR